MNAQLHRVGPAASCKIGHCAQICRKALAKAAFAGLFIFRLSLVPDLPLSAAAPHGIRCDIVW